MSRIYATEPSGKKHLVRIECDSCDESIKPNPKIAESGWRVEGFSYGPGEPFTHTYYCPTCWRNRRDW